MPETPVNAFEWMFGHDLSSLLNAATYEARYQKTDAAKGWDSATYDDIGLFQGESDPDLVIIRATFDGNEDEVIRGVVDRSSRGQNSRGVVGILAGRDRMAMVLDRYPSEPFTLQGITVVNNLPVAGQTYRQAVQIVAGLAGLSVMWNVDTDDYDLGKTIPVTTDQTFGTILEQLLAPWHFSRKYSHDAWVDGDTLRIVRRDLGAATVSVPYGRLRVTDYHKTVMPLVNDVRIEGATYETIVDDPEDEECPGIREFSESVVVWKDGAPDPDESFVENRAEHLNDECQVILSVLNRVYGDSAKTESIIDTFELIDNPGHPAHGKPASKVTEVRESNIRAIAYTGGDDATKQGYIAPANRITQYNLLLALRERTVYSYTYFDDNGDTKTQRVSKQTYGGSLQRDTADWSVSSNTKDLSEVDTNGDKKIDTLLESKQTILSYYFSRSRGLLHRFVTQIATDVFTGAVTQSFGQDEVSPFTVGASTGSIIPRGKRQETAQISCGPETAKRRVQSDMIGNASAACLIRSRIAEEHGLALLDISVELLPDHNIKPGRRLNITGAPAWFDETNLYILSVDIRKDSRGAAMNVRGIAFIAI